MGHFISTDFAGALPKHERLSSLDDIDELFRVYGARVFRFVLLSVKDHDAAQSITQDCFLKAHRSRESFRGECAVSTWLIRIAYNLVRDHTRTDKFRFWKAVRTNAIDVTEAADQIPGAEASPEARLLAMARVKEVWAVVEKLSAKQRNVFTLHFVEEMTLDEIASATGMSVATVKTHLYRAIGNVRTQFKERP